MTGRDLGVHAGFERVEPLVDELESVIDFQKSVIEVSFDTGFERVEMLTCGNVAPAGRWEQVYESGGHVSSPMVAGGFKQGESMSFGDRHILLRGCEVRARGSVS